MELMERIEFDLKIWSAWCLRAASDSCSAAGNVRIDVNLAVADVLVSCAGWYRAPASVLQPIDLHS